MKLIASMIVAEHEIDRYLEPCVGHLLEFCDEIRAVVDADCDSPTANWLARHAIIACNPNTSFYEHEGRARQRLLDWTMEGQPTHILAIDCDEFVPDGHDVRDAVSGDGQAWSLTMQEVWKADRDGLSVRQDGGWRQHPVPILFRPGGRDDRLFRINDRQLACGREPLSVRHLAARGKAPLVGTVQHWGWTKLSARQSRYDRYALHDQGNYHAKRHLDSILWSDGQVELSQEEWPETMIGLRDDLLVRVNG